MTTAITNIHTTDIIKALDRTIRAARAQYQIAMKVHGTILMADHGLRFRLVATPLHDANGLTSEAKAWRRHAATMGLDPAWLGQSVRLDGRQVTVIGLVQRRSKRPVLVQDTEGGLFVFPVESIRQGFAQQAQS
jgi:hypothetical protein